MRCNPSPETPVHRTATLLLALSLAACGGDGATTDTALHPEDTDTTDPAGTPPVEPTCGPIELCTRSTQECGYDVTVEVCASWYDQPANCADMDAYTECNCGCIGEATCDAYYACGEICFADHC